MKQPLAGWHIFSHSNRLIEAAPGFALFEGWATTNIDLVGRIIQLT